MYDKDFIISFVRHCESYGNVDLPDKPLFHPDDPPLTPLGLRQAQALGEDTVLEDTNRIFSSTLIRTVQTIYPTAVRLNKKIVLLPELMEEDTVIPGTNPQLLKEKYPLAVWPENGVSPAGGALALGDENFELKVRRAKRCIEFFFDTAESGEHITAVTHGSFFGYLIREALGFPDRPTCRWQVNNCCVTRVIFSAEEKPKLAFSNYTGHLAKLPARELALCR